MGEEADVEFAEYVAARRPTLVRAAVLLGCPVADAEDLAQTALARALRSWSRVQRADVPDAYVHRILVDAWRDLRARRWQGEVPTDVLPEEAVDVDLATGLAVRRALASLGHDHREVLVLRYYLDLTERATADVLGVAPGTVKSRTARALTALAATPGLREGVRDD